MRPPTRGDAALRIERKPTPYFTRGRDGHAPLGVVLHSTAGSFAGTVQWFSEAASGVSAHYLVGLGGEVAQFVDEKDTARHAGRVQDPTAPAFLLAANPNLVTIGIEFVDDGDPQGCERTPEQTANGAELLWAIATRWSIPLDREHVVGHREISAETICPGNLDVEGLVAAARDLDAEP